VRDKALRWLPVAVLAVGALAAWLMAHGRPGPEARERSDPSPLVQVLEVRPRDLQVTVRSQGAIQPRTEIDLVAEVPGRVVAIAPALAAGGSFEEGAVLIELDRHDAQVALDRARAGLVRSESETILAAKRLKRLRGLADHEIASTADLEAAYHEERIARAQRDEARAALAQATRNLERTRILAPFSGRVRSKHVDTGQYVAAGTPVARIYSSDAFEVRLPISSSDLAYLDLPDSRLLDRNVESFPPVRLTADFAGHAATWTGRIVRTGAAIAPQSRMLHLVARVDGPRSEPGSAASRAQPVPLTVGLFVQAEILGRSYEDVFVVPRSALRAPSEVLVVDGGGRLRARAIDVLKIDGERVLAESGLAPGERVALDAAQRPDGMRVRAALVNPENSP
jgi:RND family efflux transporter MFP subunit